MFIIRYALAPMGPLASVLYARTSSKQQVFVDRAPEHAAFPQQHSPSTDIESELGKSCGPHVVEEFVYLGSTKRRNLQGGCGASEELLKKKLNLLTLGDAGDLFDDGLVSIIPQWQIAVVTKMLVRFEGIAQRSDSGLWI